MMTQSRKFVDNAYHSEAIWAVGAITVAVLFVVLSWMLKEGTCGDNTDKWPYNAAWWPSVNTRDWTEAEWAAKCGDDD